MEARSKRKKRRSFWDKRRDRENVSGQPPK